MENEAESWLEDPQNQQSAMNIQKLLELPLKSTKTFKQAKMFRMMGNHFLPTCNSVEDIQNVYTLYARAIAHAPLESRELAMSYSNLSTVLLRLGKHAECLQAIESCFSADYPEESKFNLMLRKIECLKVLDESQKVKDTYREALGWIQKGNRCEKIISLMKTKLDEYYKKQVEIKIPFSDEEADQVWNKFSIKAVNKEVPGVSSAVALEYNESQGRHLVATRDIRPGEVILKERPYLLVCSEDCRFKRCWHCLKTLTNCIACDCCENVIFCSVNCKEEAWKEYHSTECQLLPMILSFDLSAFFNHVVIALRAFLLAIKEYGSIQKLRKAAKKMEQSKDPRTKGFAGGKLLGDKYMGFYYLQPHADFESKDIKADPMAFEIATAIVYHIARTTTLLGDQILEVKELSKNKDIIFACGIFIRHLYILRNNQFNVVMNYPWTGKINMFNLTIPASLMSHSCAPNTFVMPAKTCTKAIAVGPIKKGDQIFANYFFNENLEKEERQTTLKKIYNFSCTCVACTNDWPLPANYPKMEELPEKCHPILSSTAKTTAPYVEAVEKLELTHGKNDRKNQKFLSLILKQLSESIEKLTANVPTPCAGVKQLQDMVVALYIKLHSGQM